VIHAALKDEQLLPQEHVVDTGYLDAALLVSSQQEYVVDLVGPTHLDDHRQAQERTGFALEHFPIDWDNWQRVPACGCCPEGHLSNRWTPAVDRRHNQVIKVKFSGRDCRRCPSRERCTRSVKHYPRRTITIRTREAFDALLVARQRVYSSADRTTDAKRASCEGTLPPAAHVLHRRGARPPRPRPRRDRAQLRAPRRVAGRHPVRQGPPLAVRHADGRLRTRLRATRDFAISSR